MKQSTAAMQGLFSLDEGITEVLGLRIQEYLVVDEAIELARASDMSTGWGENGLSIQVLPEPLLLPSTFSDIKTKWKSEHPNEVSNRKTCLYRYGTGSPTRDVLSLSLKETEWEEVQPVHAELSGRRGSDLRALILKPLLADRAAQFPNILTVHGILETSDNAVVLAQRSSKVRYHPLCWSASFEEQIEPQDVVNPTSSSIHRASVRGVSEEFVAGHRLSPSICKVLALIVEFGIINPAAVVYIRIPFSQQELLRARQDVTSSLDEFEQGRIAFVPLDIEQLAHFAIAQYCRLSNSSRGLWHPTSRYRILIAMLHNFGEEETLRALEKAIG